ncbi:MAG: DCC1-like thiol-disulfide oxidoreductase family protein, partial [Planctomycetaceae bacterium]
MRWAFFGCPEGVGIDLTAAGAAGRFFEKGGVDEMSGKTLSEPRFEIFFDGDCPLCRREMEMWQRYDRGGRVLFTDI